MSRDIRESDWKVFRELRAIALERFCDGVLAEIAGISVSTDESAHQRYLKIYRLIKRRDRELAAAFDILRRSTARQQLAAIQSRELLSDDEFARFSPELRESVQRLIEISRA